MSVHYLPFLARCDFLIKKIEDELSDVPTFTKAGWPVMDPDGVSYFVLEHAKDLFEALRMAQSIASESTAEREGTEQYG